MLAKFNVVVGMFFFVLFILAGFACLGFSTYAEFEVIQGFFSKYPPLIPLLIVLSFEISKYFFVYFIESIRLNTVKSVNYSDGLIGIFFKLRTFLIAFSMFCTIIYAMNSLYNPEATNQIKMLTTQATQAFDKDYNEYKDTLDKERNSILKPYREEMAKWQKAMDDEKNIKDRFGNYIGKNYTTYETKYQLCRDNLTMEEERINKDCQTRLSDFKSTFTMGLENQIIELTNSSKSDNTYISNALNSFYRALGTSTEYPRQLYFIVVLIISLFFAGLIELVVWSSSKVLAINVEDWFGNKMNVINNFAANSKVTVLNALVAGGLFLFGLIVLSAFINSNSLDLFSLSTVILIASFIFANLISNNVKKSMKSSVRPKSILGKMRESFVSSFVSILTTTAITLVIMVIVGYFYPQAPQITSYFELSQILLSTVFAHTSGNLATHKVNVATAI